MENSRFVQMYGLELFMEQQKVKYTCPQCSCAVKKQKPKIRDIPPAPHYSA